MLLLISTRIRNPRSTTSLSRCKLPLSKIWSVSLSALVIGGLLVAPLASQAHPSASQLAQHQARLAKKQAQHKARLAKLSADHKAALAGHLARLAKKRRFAQQHLASARLNHAKHYAKLHKQHLALKSGNVVEAAYAFRGSPYVMGGTSRSGFDCSGFVRYILSNAGGVSVPRTAVEQYYRGTPIATKDLQPGDLVFFRDTYKHGISHVGIYAGNGKFIHAANPRKGVRMDSLNEAYYKHHYAGARRVLPEQMREAAYLAQ